MSVRSGIRAGGQAVLEGVMMRSPKYLSVAVRTPDGKIVLREERWRSFGERKRTFRKPFFRGVATLIETLVNGIQALSFSADVIAKEEGNAAGGKDADGDKKARKSGRSKRKGQKKEGLSTAAVVFTILSAFAFAIAIFVVLPHVLTLLFGRVLHWKLDVNSLAFHIIDGIIKIAFFVAYIWGISFMKDIRRVFEYHGAEHKSIFAYEHRRPLSVEAAREFGTHHPRCGTSFLLVVLIISILLFAVVFPLLPEFSGLHPVLRQALFILIKIALLFPVAGISYEVIRAAGKSDHPVLRVLVWPGVALQRITTREPDDSQLEVALLALISVLLRESSGAENFKKRMRTFDDFESALAAFEEEVRGESAAQA